MSLGNALRTALGWLGIFTARTRYTSKLQEVDTDSPRSALAVPTTTATSASGIWKKLCAVWNARLISANH
jgi:hypothetical protein